MAALFNLQNVVYEFYNAQMYFAIVTSVSPHPPLSREVIEKTARLQRSET